MRSHTTSIVRNCLILILQNQRNHKQTIYLMEDVLSQFLDYARCSTFATEVPIMGDDRNAKKDLMRSPNSV